MRTRMVLFIEHRRYSMSTVVRNQLALLTCSSEHEFEERSLRSVPRLRGTPVGMTPR